MTGRFRAAGNGPSPVRSGPCTARCTPRWRRGYGRESASAIQADGVAIGERSVKHDLLGWPLSADALRVVKRDETALIPFLSAMAASASGMPSSSSSSVAQSRSRYSDLRDVAHDGARPGRGARVNRGGSLLPGLPLYRAARGKREQRQRPVPAGPQPAGARLQEIAHGQHPPQTVGAGSGNSALLCRGM